MAKPNLLREAIAALERLEVAEGRLAKEAILRANQDNLALQAIIKMAIGPDRYFVRPSVNIVPTSALSATESWRELRDLLDRLKNRQLTGNAAKKEVAQFLSQCRPLLLKWFCRILNRDLRCGADRSTIQKVWGDTFLLSDSAVGATWHYNGCMLAKSYEKVYRVMKRGERKPKFPMGLEPKLDGERANLICFPRDKVIYVLTRSGRRRPAIEAVPEYVEQVLNFCRAMNDGVNPDRPLFLDGEFLARKWNDTSSIVRRTKSFDAPKFLKEVRTILWDWAPLDQYMAGRFDVKWLLRKSQLLHAAGVTRPTAKPISFSTNVWVMGHSMVYDVDQMQVEYQRCLDAKHEGAMLKNPDAPHVFKRSSDLIKLKPEDERTGRIIEILSGEDHNAAVAKSMVDKANKLMCQYGEVEDKPPYLHCNVGTHEKARTLVSSLKELIEGDNENRISRHRDGYISFRTGERLGRFVVELDDGKTVRVGGGFTTKAGNDQRTEYWRKREELVGMMVDFKQQKGDTADAVSRFPVFVRLREDR